MLELVPIERDGLPRGYEGELDEGARDVLAATFDFYREVGFDAPWISYLAVMGSTPVGVCSFKSAPARGRVEIGYFTFPGHEGRGVATAMAAELVAIAAAHDPEVLVTAQTLPERGASHRVLEKLGFRATGTVEHAEDGLVLEWHRSRVER
jgi:RimJ/RimL family protein N-acetyltransferase